MIMVSLIWGNPFREKEQLTKVDYPVTVQYPGLSENGGFPPENILIYLANRQMKVAHTIMNHSLFFTGNGLLVSTMSRFEVALDLGLSTYSILIGQTTKFH